MDLIQASLFEALETHAPRRIVCVARGEPAALTVYLERYEDSVVERLAPESAAALRGLGRFEYGLVYGLLETLSVADGSALIARLRDLHCRRLCVVWQGSAPPDGTESWTRERFLSLALMLWRRVDQDGSCAEIYLHDIDTYNPRRQWNNPDRWANPGNFRRYRW